MLLGMKAAKGGANKQKGEVSADAAVCIAGAWLDVCRAVGSWLSCHKWCAGGCYKGARQGPCSASHVAGMCTISTAEAHKPCRFLLLEPVVVAV